MGLLALPLSLLVWQESAVAAAAVFKRSAPVLLLLLLQVLQVPARKRKRRKRKALFNQVVNRWTSKNPGAQTTTTGEKTHSSMTMLKTMIICHRLLLPLFPAYCFKKSTAK